MVTAVVPLLYIFRGKAIVCSLWFAWPALIHCCKSNYVHRVVYMDDTALAYVVAGWTPNYDTAPAHRIIASKCRVYEHGKLYSGSWSVRYMKHRFQLIACVLPRRYVVTACRKRGIPEPGADNCTSKERGGWNRGRRLCNGRKHVPGQGGRLHQKRNVTESPPDQSRLPALPWKGQSRAKKDVNCMMGERPQSQVNDNTIARLPGDARRKPSFDCVFFLVVSHYENAHPHRKKVNGAEVGSLLQISLCTRHGGT